MWIVTEIGFFSVVSYDEARDPDTKTKVGKKETYISKGKTYTYWAFPKFLRPKVDPKVMVRARVRADLDRLIGKMEEEGIPKPELKSWANRDYPYRVVVLQRDWAKVAQRLCQDIEYVNFKNHIKAFDPDGYERSHIYMQIWSALNGMERQLQRAKDRLLSPKKKGKSDRDSNRVEIESYWGDTSYWGDWGAPAEDETEVDPSEYTQDQIASAAVRYFEDPEPAEGSSVPEKSLEDLLISLAYDGYDIQNLSEEDLRSVVSCLHSEGLLDEEVSDPLDPFSVIEDPTFEDLRALAEKKS